MKIREALHEAAARLRASGIIDARPDARALLSYTLARDHAYLVAHSDEEIMPDALALYHERIARRATGEPLQYITGRQEFYGLDFEVTPAVLIPRPETELLVETALELLRETDAPGAPLLCDVGTGSGCIAVTLLHERMDARAFGLDISTDALAVAARNAARHAVAERLTLRVSDCFDALAPAGAPFTLITSNPPYIPARDIPQLQREVREHEPLLALTPHGDEDGDGLSIIRRLIRDAAPFLIPGGHLLLEIGHDQHDRIAPLVAPNIWTMLDTRHDLQGIPRTVVLQRRRAHD
ncbi:MAG TPA: peptide chain release factor N(5)-glutamine methyltransferase [Pyrinomonadaceae bacterium]|jgi:release factor glutamine methyltransferase|nr:peptide chain release factor N(5)-glutamine methyltransferase [Pyrinomonadaceae bacterium]